MFSPRPNSSIWLSVLILVLAMASIQSGAALAKTLFVSVGAPGITALRLALGAAILAVVFKPWRLRFSAGERLPLILYGVSLGSMNYAFYLSLRTIPLGIAVALEFIGPLALALAGARRPLDFLWVLLALIGLWLLLPLNSTISNIDLQGAMLAVLAGAFWALYILAGKRAGCRHGSATVSVGTLIACCIFVPLGVGYTDAEVWTLSLLPAGLAIATLSTALPYSLEMLALTRLPAKSFGTLMSMEPGLAAVSGMIFLGEMLTLIQWIGLLAIVLASAGSTLMLRPVKSKIRTLDTPK